MIWKSYIDDREICEYSEGFVVIRPRVYSSPIPLSCSLCHFLMKSRDDEESYNEFGCCHLCALTWAHSRRLEWKAGWRPQKEAIASSISQRPAPNIRFDV